VERAKWYEAQGAAWIHVVDLDAAEGRGGHNRAVLEKIRRAVSCRVQVGGGIRIEADARQLLESGMDRLVLGTILVREPEEAARWVTLLGRRFAGGIDADGGRVKVSGWVEDGGLSDTEVAAGLSGLGLEWLVYTSISRDGTLAGPDVDSTNLAARAAGLPTILSGGIGSDADVQEVFSRRDPLIHGVILGKALYEGKVDLASLISRFAQAPELDW
jgi:phosphoribosylformimino-5-aminoimidazole carboxamide ribotide isomerase